MKLKSIIIALIPLVAGSFIIFVTIGPRLASLEKWLLFTMPLWFLAVTLLVIFVGSHLPSIWADFPEKQDDNDPNLTDP